MPERSQEKYLHTAVFWLLVVFLVSIVFSFRAVSSIGIGLLLVAGIIHMKKNKLPFFTKHPLFIFAIACILLYLLKLMSLLYTEHNTDGMKHLQKTSALIFVPMAVYACRNTVSATDFRKLMTFLACAIFAASIYCLLHAFIKYASGAHFTVFFYHELVKPLSQHAIQLSILVFISLIFLMESLSDQTSYINRTWSVVFIVFFALFLFLLASKLIILFFLAYLVFFSLKSIRKKKLSNRSKWILVSIPIVCLILILATPNPVSHRFKELTSGNRYLYKQEKFHPGDYFNGLQFRLLQWRFVFEILNEKESWPLGLSPGDTQPELDQKYISTNMYIGKPGTNEKGFRGYHTHNQFLQVLLQNGIAGLLVFLMMCFGLLKMFALKKDTLLRFTIALLLLYCFTDAILETQYGLILFTFFPPFIYLNERNNS